MRAGALDDDLMLAPADAGGADFRRAAGGGAHTAGIDLGDGARAPPVPAIIVAIPVIMVVDGEDFPVERLRLGLAGRIDRGDFKARIGAFFQIALEGRLQAEIEPLRAVRHADAVSDGAPAGLKHADNGIEAQRNVGIRPRRTGREAHGRLALAIGRGVSKFEDLLAEGRVMAAIAEALKRTEGHRIRLKARLCAHSQASARRAIQETGIDGDIARAAGRNRRRFIRCQINGDALRHEILDREAHLPGRRGQAIDLKHGAPFAPAGTARQGVGMREGAGSGIAEAHPLGGQTVRPVDHEMAAAPGDAAPGAVADHGDEFDILAGAVNAALGIEIGVHRTGDTAPADRVFGEVNRGAVEVEGGQFAARIGREHEARGERPLPAHQRRLEAHAALLVRPAFTEHGIIGRDQLDLCIGNGAPVAQRADSDVEAVLAGIGGQRQIGEQDPAAGRDRHPAAVIGGGNIAHAHEIGARRHRADRVLDREDCGDGVVLLRGDAHAPGEQCLADIGRIVLTPEIAIAALAGGHALGDPLEGQGTVIDAQHLDLDLIDIHRLDGKAIGILARQDDPGAAEADIGRPVGKIDGHGLAALQAPAIGGRQALAQGRGVRAAKGETTRAELLAIDRQRRAHCGSESDKGAIVRLLIERGGKDETGQRRVGGGVDPVADEGEVLLGGGRCALAGFLTPPRRDLIGR